MAGPTTSHHAAERSPQLWAWEETLAQKLRKLEGFLVQYGLPLAQVVPLFAALLSLPLPAEYAPLSLAPTQQKQQLCTPC
jgi:hypothetical protein